ncbi:TIGR04104 family putative zinc finger protein [Bacillus alkalicellulosilyticus]|uniref:TIGR04104 family putative zinc finger protein n=1 Tax=Alkalihalobacterium alkalicellulosilyticum TaxID=1912214 RepID=UPI000996DB71|nr:TIGR04104 family putative zinc finger protein [Bacillus alkalicellulosilyticus]
MKLASCRSCERSFTWSKLYKSLWKLRDVQCEHCQQKHPLSLSTKFRVHSISYLTAILGLFTADKLGLSMLESAIFILLLTLTLSLFYPFIVKWKE